MKLLINNNRIMGAALDEYMGPMEWITAPEDFDVEKFDEYRLINGQAVIPTAVITNETIKQQRQDAYKAESDPLFFKAQRQEATMQDWLDKVDEIKTRFPYQE